ncbi:MAG: hypothetical protein V9F04_13820 [Dermatophilaceae bacterium]
MSVGIDRDGGFAEVVVAAGRPTCGGTRSRSTRTSRPIFDPFGNAVHSALAFEVLGEDVLVTGAGPIGIMAAPVARHAGARNVVITDLSPERLALARVDGRGDAGDRRAFGEPARRHGRSRNGRRASTSASRCRAPRPRCTSMIS